MFHPEKNFKEVVFEILKGDGKSISALSRELEERGYSIHRLILTGYLRALTDLNILREREVPPSKVYVPVKGRDHDFYEIVGNAARQVAPPEKADELILYSLSRICRRPIFMDELKKAGVQSAPPGRNATSDERIEAKKVLQKAGFKVSDNNLAFLPTTDLNDLFQELLISIVIESLNAGYIVRETKQTKLTL